jgi:hypothetical protein
VSLAYGVLLSLLEVAQGHEKARPVLLTSCHHEMQKIYEGFGFKPERQNRPFALGPLQPPIDLPCETSSWLVNFDWGDKGLRVPFLDQDVTASTDNSGQS